MTDIAQSTGIQKASIYYFFPSKEQLVLEALLPGVEAPYRGLLPIVHGEGSSREKVVRGMRSLGHQFDVLPDVMQVLVRERLENYLTGEALEHIQRFKQLYTDLWHQLVAEGVARGEFRPVRQKLAVFGLLGALNWMYAWFDPDGPLTGEQIGQQLAELLLDGLAQPEPH